MVSDGYLPFATDSAFGLNTPTKGQLGVQGGRHKSNLLFERDSGDQAIFLSPCSGLVQEAE